MPCPHWQVSLGSRSERACFSKLIKTADRLHAIEPRPLFISTFPRCCLEFYSYPADGITLSVEASSCLLTAPISVFYKFALVRSAISERDGLDVFCPFLSFLLM